MEFQWDSDNEEHIAEHNVTIDEVEEAFYNHPVSLGFQVRHGEKRYVIVSKTDSGRYLTIVYVIQDRLIRVITAFNASPKRRRIYKQRRER